MKILVPDGLAPEGVRRLQQEAEVILDQDMPRAGLRIVNCARGGLLDEEALRGALEEGIVAGAALVAQERGITLSEVRREESEDFSSLIRARLETGTHPLELGGTLIGRREPRITHLNDYRIDLAPAPTMLFVWNVDRPGMIGQVGSILGRHHVNIAGMQVGRVTPGATAVMVLTVDSLVPREAVQEIAGVDGITAVKVLQLYDNS